MITFHEIRRVIQKMAVLSGHIVKLNQLLPEVIRLSEKIDSLNEDLTLERDRMTAKIRSVEVLGEILKTHIYQNPTIAGQEHQWGNITAARGDTAGDEPSRAEGTVQPGDPNPATDGGSRGCFHPKLDGSSMML
ncbi:MAG: hypothetical protein JSU74_08925 [Candidatus Zixiibacteriota bacterium]|nr:MAG: hypothetical protein JSU74_08925 [candidate division Zixibacteria bacterium]